MLFTDRTHHGAVAASAAGLLLPWGPWDSSPWLKPTNLPDRFFIGGPETLRGFEFHGVGPSDVRRTPAPATAGAAATEAEANVPKRDALGGDLFCGIFAALGVPLPGRFGEMGLHAHAFVNGGSSVLVAGRSRDSSTGAEDGSSLGGLLRQKVKQLGQTMRWSTGLGLVAPTPFGRFEANFVWVLTHQEHDRLKRGFQFGFATDHAMRS